MALSPTMLPVLLVCLHGRQPHVAPSESSPDVCSCPVAVLLDLYGSRRRQLLFLLLHGMMSTIGSMTIPPIALLLALGHQPRAGPQRVSSRPLYMSGRHSSRLVRLASSAATVTVSAFAWRDVDHRQHDDTSDRFAFAFCVPIWVLASCGPPASLFQTYVHVRSPFSSTCTARVVGSSCYCSCFCMA
jgi:hypothetical protein